MTTSARLALAVALSTVLAACGASHSGSASIGPQGGTVSTPSGVTLKVAPGALQAATVVTITEAAPRRSGSHRRIELEPRGLALSAPALVSVKVEGDASGMKLVEVEDGASGEVEHALETEQHNGLDNARQAEIEHLGTLEVRDAASCAVACDAGLECDDGACKPHDEVEASESVTDDHGVDPAPAPGTTPTTCPAGMELDASDGICKAHGGSGGGSGTGP